MKSKKIPVGILVLMLITAVLVTICGIAFKQDVWKMIPLYVSLFIALLQSRVSRFAPLLGGANSLLYTAVYFSYALYGQALYALFVSCPLQIITFVRWQKRKSGGSTILRKLSRLMRVLAVIIFIVTLVIVLRFAGDSDSKYYVLDNTVMLLGIFATVLMMLSYIEYTVLMVASGCCNIFLYISMLETNPEQLTYLVYTIYALICSSLALVRAHRTLRDRENGFTTSEKTEGPSV